MLLAELCSGYVAVDLICAESLKLVRRKQLDVKSANQAGFPKNVHGFGRNLAFIHG